VSDFEILKAIEDLKKEQQKPSMLDAFLYGARGAAADLVGGLGSLAAVLAGVPAETVEEPVQEIRGEAPGPIEGWGRLAEFLGSSLVTLPTLAIPELWFSRALGGSRLISGLVGAGMGGLTGALMGDPDEEATARALSGAIGAGLGGTFGALFPAMATKTVSKKLAEDVVAHTPASLSEPLFVDPGVKRFAAKTLVGALSGGVIGGLWLPPTDEEGEKQFFSPAGAAAGAVVAGLGAAYGEALASKVRHLWDVGEQKLLGGLGPVLKPIAKEAELLRSSTAEDIAERIKLGLSFAPERREAIGKAIDGFIAAHNLKPEEQEFARLAVEHSHSLYKKLVDLEALDPAVAPPERFIEGLSNELTGYMPHVYNKKAAEQVLGEEGSKHPAAQTLAMVGDVTKGRGISVPFNRIASKLRKKLPGMNALDPEQAKVGDTIFDGQHVWTVLQKPKGKGKVLWREYTEEEMAQIGRNWDVLLGMAKMGTEHSRLLADAYLFKTIASDSTLATADKKFAKEVGWVFVENDVTPGGFKRYGALAGKYVRPDVADALRNYAALREMPDNKLYTLMRDLNSTYKKVYLGYNQASYKNAVLGNIMLSYLHGYNPFAIAKEGIKALRDKDFARELRRLGVTHSTSMDVDFRSVLDSVTKAEEAGDSFVHKFLAAASDVGRKVAEGGIRFYASIDAAFKAGLVKHLVDKGVDIEQAVLKANDVLTSSELVPRRIGMLRDTLVPYITFYYRFLERTLPEVLANPHRLLAVGGVIDALQMASLYDTYGEKWREGLKYENAVLPWYKRISPGGLFADAIRTPWGFFNAAFTMGLPFSLAQNERLHPAIALFLQNPVLVLGWSVLTGRNPSTDQPVTAMQSLIKTLPTPWPRSAIKDLAAYMPHPAVLWFNTAGTSPYKGDVNDFSDAVSKLLYEYPTLFNLVLPTYAGPAGKEYIEEEAMRHLRRIQRAAAEHVGYLKGKARGAGEPNVAQAYLEEAEKRKQEAQEEIDRILGLQRATRTWRERVAPR